MAKHAADIGKDARDLIANDFPIDGSIKFTAQSKTPDNVSTKAVINRALKKEKSTIREVISASVEPKFEWKDKNVELSTKFTSSNDLSGTLLLKNLSFLPKYELSVTGTQSEREGTSVEFIGSLLHSKIGTKGSFLYPVSSVGKKPIKGSAELTGYYKNWFTGLRVVLNTDNLTAPKVEGLVSFNNNPIEVSGGVTHDLKEETTSAQLSFYHKYRSDVKYAAEFNVDVASTKTSANLAGEYKLDDSTTLKAKWVLKPTDLSEQPQFRLVGSVKQQISPVLTSTIGVDLNVTTFFGESTGDAHSFGLDIKFQ
eukprot:TRINITY_DN19136_c0_g1_i1.p1 TRINITY_DN19136_c0_g1~~TRINITY_DN19136_c0_g1_i1.p1  ORF type:complete len:311 (-),score=58.06 TRINITY_DN19136_c0_g1_i1:81-1013(-)